MNTVDGSREIHCVGCVHPSAREPQRRRDAAAFCAAPHACVQSPLLSSHLISSRAGGYAQQVELPVPSGCSDPRAVNYDPTARSDDGSCLYDFSK